MEQRSDEWFLARLGKVTASRVADVVARTKTGWGASRANYMAELLIERLSGQPTASYINDAMRWGNEQEPLARDAYCWRNNVTIEEVGFVPHPTIEMSGASPDGLVGEDGLIEIKCPNSATHLDVLLSKTIPDKYFKQMQWQMDCTGREWCDWMSFDPRLPSELSVYIQRVERDDKLIAGLRKDVEAFLAELDQKIVQLKAEYYDRA